MSRKRPRKFVDVRWPMPGSFLQECYLKGVPGHPNSLVGPVLVDLDSSEPVVPELGDNLKVISDVRTEFKSADKFEDRNFYHSYFSGKLNAYTSNISVPAPLVTIPWNEYEGIYGTAYITRDLLVDARMKDAPEPQMFFCALCSGSGSFTRAEYYTSYDEKVLSTGSQRLLRSIRETSDGTSFFRDWDLDGNVTSTEEWKFLGVHPLLDQWNVPVGRFQFAVDVAHKGYVGGANGADFPWDNWLNCPVELIPTGPAIRSEPDPDGSILERTREQFQLSFIEELNQIEYRNASLTGDDDLAIECVDALRTLNINGLAFLSDIASMKSFIQPVIKLIKSKMLDPKAWADFLLWWRYGAKLTYKDWRTILAAFKNVKKVAKSLEEYFCYRTSLQTRYAFKHHETEEPLFKSTIRSTHRGRLTARLSVPNEALALQGLILLVQDMDIRLSFENEWDLIPFSFVVDWFFSVGDLLEKIDYSQEIKNLQVKNFIVSREIQGEVPSDYLLERYGLVGQLHYEIYMREVTYELPPPQYVLESKLARLTNHWYEGGLLILQQALKS